MPATRLAERVVARLVQAEVKESDPHLRDDLRIARLTVAYAASGEAVCCTPNVLASYMVLGLHPDRVWPAILARQETIAPRAKKVCPSVWKKPAESVKLWTEETNAARVSGSRGEIHNESPRLTINVPMAAPSIAALYPNSDAPSSAKKRQFSYDELLALVQWSGAPLSVKTGTIAAIIARGRWPKEDGPATYEICVSLMGMMVDGSCCKRTAQRRAKRACELGFWRRTRNLNSWLPCPKCSTERNSAKCVNCGHRGNSRNLKEFRRPFTYEINVEQFQSAPRPREIRSIDWRTYAEYKAAAKRGEHPNVTEMPARPTTPVPPARPAEPVRKTAEHQRQERAQQPKLSKTEASKFLADVTQLMRSQRAPIEGPHKPDCAKCHGTGKWTSPAHPGSMLFCPCGTVYPPKMTTREAIAETCTRWRRDPDAVIASLKFWGHSIQLQE